ncbi:hypothetical protein GCM10022380_51730 [Amycolatopsis tucumanensis]|uniref:Uncharacterized protein n=1 Tax=Amycolatopsis tucumanensis TaxID=401106 RepID=A0ABP7ITQ7_9PSEU
MKGSVQQQARAHTRRVELQRVGQYEPNPHQPNPPRQETREGLLVHVPKTLPDLNPTAASTLLNILEDLAAQNEQPANRTRKRVTDPTANAYAPQADGVKITKTE